MTENKALELVKNHFGGIIVSCSVVVPNTEYRVVVKPGKHYVKQVLSREGIVNILEVDFVAKEMTLIVMDSV